MNKPYCYICHKYIKPGFIKGVNAVKEHNLEYHREGFYRVIEG